jgi:hypothetical protein
MRHRRGLVAICLYLVAVAASAKPRLVIFESAKDWL